MQGQKSRLRVLAAVLNGRLNKLLFNIRKFSLNVAFVISAIGLTSYSLSASCDEGSIQSESKSPSTISFTESSEEKLVRYQKMFDDGQSLTKEELAVLEKAAEQQLNLLQKQIDEQQKASSKRPRRIFVGARTKDYRLALYIEKWRQKIEKAGNQNYPKEAAAKHIYGKVQATVSIMANGTVEFTEINKSSGHKILDDHVLDTIKRAAPYQPFDDNLKKDVDILSITRTWQYLSEPSADGAENWFVSEVEEQI